MDKTSFLNSNDEEPFSPGLPLELTLTEGDASDVLIKDEPLSDEEQNDANNPKKTASGINPIENGVSVTITKPSYVSPHDPAGHFLAISGSPCEGYDITKKHKCQTCPQTFKNLKMLKKHALTHRPFRCMKLCGKRCKKKCSSESRSKMHKKIVAASQEPSNTINRPSADHLLYRKPDGYSCHQCDAVFETNALLKAHSKTHSQFLCVEHCGRSFSTYLALKNHQMVVTGEKPFDCTQCEKKFINKTLLNYHMRIHNNEKLYKCSYCDQSFVHVATMEYHVKGHTGKGMHECTICSKLFKLKQQLARHLRVHTGERPCLCYVCGKGFTHQTHLKRHLQMHTGVKLYQCSVCKKEFSQKWYFNKHTLLHTDDNTHACEICGKRLVSNSSLQKHRETHLGKTRKRKEKEVESISIASV